MPHQMNPMGQVGQGAQLSQSNVLINDKSVKR